MFDPFLDLYFLHILVTYNQIRIKTYSQICSKIYQTYHIYTMGMFSPAPTRHKDAILPYSDCIHITIQHPPFGLSDNLHYKKLLASSKIIFFILFLKKNPIYGFFFEKRTFSSVVFSLGLQSTIIADGT